MTRSECVPTRRGVGPHRPPRALARIAAALALGSLVACTGGSLPTVPVRTLACELLPAGSPTPTLRCTTVGGTLILEIPWQGQAVQATSLPLDGFGSLPTANGFEPLGYWPILRLGVRDAATYAPVTAFDPPLQLTVRYGASQYGATTPTWLQGELGLGAWNSAQSRWAVVGQGVFHEGFWIADPVGGAGLALVNDPANAQPRFQMRGTPAGGEAIALLAELPPGAPIAWGAMQRDRSRRLVPFDGPCANVLLDGVPAVECVSSEAGVTVRVPEQASGTITPRVIALPWIIEATYLPTAVADNWSLGPQTTELSRSLMNFLVVDAANPTTVLFDFDPPMELEVAYTGVDKDSSANPVLRMNYWDEYAEVFVVLGEGRNTACQSPDPIPVPSPGCTWGIAVEAETTSDPLFNGRFFRADLDNPEGGLAKFRFDRWGDRMVAFGR